MTSDVMKDFARLVRQMREAQQDYFRMRDSSTLRNARDLERQVDKAVRQILAQPQQQPLF